MFNLVFIQRSGKPLRDQPASECVANTYTQCAGVIAQRG
jgi:hypothetical protein